MPRLRFEPPSCLFIPRMINLASAKLLALSPAKRSSVDLESRRFRLVPGFHPGSKRYRTVTNNLCSPARFPVPDLFIGDSRHAVKSAMKCSRSTFPTFSLSDGGNFSERGLSEVAAGHTPSRGSLVDETTSGTRASIRPRLARARNTGTVSPGFPRSRDFAGRRLRHSE